MVSTYKNISQIGSFPQVGLKKTYIKPPPRSYVITPPHENDLTNVPYYFEGDTKDHKNGDNAMFHLSVFVFVFSQLPIPSHELISLEVQA